MRQPIGCWACVFKLLGDRLLAFVLLIVVSPIMLSIAVAVKLTAPGPILYRQLRSGLNGQPIVVLKFRTMHVESCDPPDATDVCQATRNDPRTTPVGRLLRRRSLDELPQLLNVLRGEISLVGPRPHAIAHDRYYGELIENYFARQRVKPGITGWAQVKGCRGETRSLEEMRRRIELDIEYAQNWSLQFDLKSYSKPSLLGSMQTKPTEQILPASPLAIVYKPVGRRDRRPAGQSIGHQVAAGGEVTLGQLSDLPLAEGSDHREAEPSGPASAVVSTAATNGVLPAAPRPRLPRERC